MKIKRLPSGNYNALVFSHTDKNGKRHYMSITAPNKAEVMRKIVQFKDGKNLYAEEMTVGECIDRYIASKENVLSPTTINDYKARRRLYFNSLENIRLSKLTREMVQGFVNEHAANLSPKSVRNIYGLLSSAIRMFSDRAYHVTMPTKKPIERHIPESKDIKQLLSTASPNMKKAILLASVGGMRRGEICGLTYSDIQGNTAYVHTDMVKGLNGGWLHKEFPKTSSSVRYVDLPQEVMEVLGEGEPFDFVCPLTPTTITKCFMELRNKHGLKCRFHDLRHYSASILHAIGCSDAFIMERNGWGSDKTLKSIYRHSLSDKSREFSKAANSYFSTNLF